MEIGFSLERRRGCQNKQGSFRVRLFVRGRAAAAPRMAFLRGPHFRRRRRRHCRKWTLRACRITLLSFIVHSVRFIGDMGRKERSWGLSWESVAVGAPQRELVCITRQLVWSMNESVCTLNHDMWIDCAFMRILKHAKNLKGLFEKLTGRTVKNFPLFSKNSLFPRQATREKCARCSEPILETTLKALERSYHPHCFTCSHCPLSLDGIQVRNQI